LQGTTVNNSVIIAAPNTRHFTIVNATLLTDGVTFVGASSGASSGGVELDGATATGTFYNTVFQHCRSAGNGGGLRLTSGASATLYTGSEVLDNAAAKGGGIYADTASTLTLEG
jgi:hypothetical protein